MIGIYAQIFSSADSIINSLVTDKYAAVASMVRGPLITAATIYFALIGYAVMRGIVSEGWGAILAAGFKMALVIAAATRSYGSWVAASANGLPSALSGAIGGGGVDGAIFDSFVAAQAKVAGETVAAAPLINMPLLGEFPDPVLILVAWIVKLMANVVACFGLAMVLFAKLGLAIILVFGPIFVALLVYDSTRGMFFTWVGAALSFVLQIAVITLMVAFVTGVVGEVSNSLLSNIPAGEPSSLPYYDVLAAQAGVLILGAVFFIFAPGMASSMAGGASAGFHQFASAALPGPYTMRMASSVAGRFGRAIGRAGGAAAKGASR